MNVNTDEHADEEAAHPAAGVGGLYDRNTELVDGAADGNIHFGYWEGDSDSSSFLEATDRLTDLVAERVPAGSGRRLLDVGCGTGRPALRLAAPPGRMSSGCRSAIRRSSWPRHGRRGPDWATGSASRSRTP